MIVLLLILVALLSAWALVLRLAYLSDEAALTRARSRDARARVSLHAARLRLESTLFKSGIRADAARLRRELDRELRDHDRQGGA